MVNLPTDEQCSCGLCAQCAKREGDELYRAVNHLVRINGLEAVRDTLACIEGELNA